MCSNSKIIVVDTSIWIDLSKTGLIDLIFNLPYSLIVTDFVLRHEKINNIEWVILEQKGLTFQELDSQEIANLYDLFQKHRNISLVDLAMFSVARKMGAILLTGDNNLRVFAATELEVHGLLWALDEMVDQSILNPNLAISRLSYILELPNIRLPRNECAQYIKKWRNK